MRGKTISGVTAVLIIAFFFLPWFSVSFNGRVLGQFSGYQLAVGGSKYALDGLNGRSTLFIIPLSALVVLIWAILAHYKPSWQKFAAAGQLVAALLGLLVLVWQWWSGGQITALVFFGEPRLWLAFLCLIFLLFSAALDFRRSYRVPIKTTESLPEPMKEEVVMETAVSLPQTNDALVPDVNPDSARPKTSTKSLYKIGVMADDPSIQAWLIVKEGENIGERFRIMPPVRIGRDAGNDIVIDDSSMSGYHAVVREQGGAFHIQDLNSTNGIYLENMTNHRWQRVPAATLVNDMRIKLGRTVFQIVIGN